MSEPRITEAELRDIERVAAHVAAYAPGVVEREANLARGVLRYIAEVRRLRALIVAGVGVVQSAELHPGAGDAFRALDQEARAIREETSPKTSPTGGCAT